MADNTPNSQASEDGGITVVPPSVHLAVGIYLLVIGVCGTLGNSVILAMFFRFRSLVTPTTILLVNLAVADLGLCLFGFPFSASSSFAHRWLYGEGGCVWYAFMGFLFGTTHIGTLTLLAVDRYLLTQRNRKMKVTYRHSYQMVAATWVYALFWATMPVLGWARYGMEPSITTCTIDWRHNDASYKSFLMLYFCLAFLIPVILIVFCYCRAARQLRGGRRQGDDWATERNVTMMTLVMVVSFILAWTPYAILCLWTVFDNPSTVPTMLTLLPPLFAKTSTVFNPIIYFLTNSRLRRGIISTVMCCQNTPPEVIELPDSPERIPTVGDT